MQEVQNSTSNIFKSYREEQEIIERVELACTEKRKDLSGSIQQLNSLHSTQSQEEERLYNQRVECAKIMEKYNKLCDLAQEERDLQLTIHLELNSLEVELSEISKQKISNNLEASKFIERMVDKRLVTRKLQSDNIKTQIYGGLHERGLTIKK